MSRIKLGDLPKDQKISKEELKRIKGGAYEFYIKELVLTNMRTIPKLESIFLKN